MFTKLTLENFKNFKQAELTLGPFTVLVGANATGKSNLRDAFRFLHGIGRGYTLPEIIDEKRDSSGEKVWDGIRGGINELSYIEMFHDEQGNPKFLPTGDFSINLSFKLPQKQQTVVNYFNKIALGRVGNLTIPYVFEEYIQKGYEYLFHAGYSQNQLVIRDAKRNDGQDEINSRFAYDMQEAARKHDAIAFLRLQRERDHLLQEADKAPLTQPFLSQINKNNSSAETLKTRDTLLEMLRVMRFPELTSNAMRQASSPGQQTLTDRGDNISSLLHTICQNSNDKQNLLSWIKELTPTDVSDFDFFTDEIGRVRVILVEGNGRRTSVLSASDGTLHFIGILATLLSPKPARFYFFEELENGIHPSRLHLLVQLIEQVTKEEGIQVVVSTHSPQLLNMVSEETLQNASLLYRLDKSSITHIQPIAAIPDAMRLAKKKGAGELHASGWFENVMYFIHDDNGIAEPVA